MFHEQLNEYEEKERITCASKHAAKSFSAFFEHNTPFRTLMVRRQMKAQP